MSADPEKVLLTRVVEKENFVASIVFSDVSDDWKLAKDLGEFFIRIGPDLAIGYALVARASRHLGDLEQATEALRMCRSLPMQPAEAEDLTSLLQEEESHLSGMRGEE